MKLNLPVEKYSLRNGLTVLLLPDQHTSLVSLHTWYRVGSRNETAGVTGAAHMLEHMMFKGAKRYSGKDFDIILNHLGAVNNAFTTNDYTGFYESFPAEHLEKILDLESDRMENLNISSQDLMSEREVVKEERRWRVDNNPGGALGEALNLNMFRKSQYSWPVIGHMKDIDAYTSEKLRFFHDNYYGPNNAVLVVVGNFDIKKIKVWIEKYYSAIPARTVPAEVFIEEPEQKQPRQFVIQKNINASRLVVAYPAVPSSHKDAPALDLLGAVLGSGTSSRLHQLLVYRKQKASSVASENGSMAKAGIFEINLALMPNVQESEVLNLVRAEVGKLRTTKVSERELQRAKTSIMKESVKRLMTADEKARVLAEYEIVYGDYKKIYSELDDYMAVTADDLLRVAKTYLITKHETVGIATVASKSEVSNHQGVKTNE